MHQWVPGPNTREIVALIGMPSAGKTKLGRLLAQRLGCDFVDTDERIVANFNVESLQRVVDTLSPSEFAATEEATVLEVVRRTRTPAIIATGGSAVYSEKAMAYTKKHAHVVHVWASLETITRRIERDPDRGLVLDPGETIADLFVRRMPLYCKWAHRVVDTNHSRSKAAKRLAAQLVEDEIITPATTLSRS